MIEIPGKKSAHPRTPPFAQGTCSKMLYNIGQRTSRLMLGLSLKPLENLLVWLMGLIVACGILINTETRTDLTTTTLYIALLLMAINLLSISAVIVVALFCMLVLTSMCLYQGGFQRWETTTDLLHSLAVLAAIMYLALRSKKISDNLRHNEVYMVGAQCLTQTACFGFRADLGRMGWSEQAARILEYPARTSPSVALFLERTHPDDLPLVLAGFEKAARHETLIEVKHRLLMPDGRIKYLHLFATPLFTRQGSFEYLGALMDVTASKEAEEALCRAQTELAHVTRVTSLGELAMIRSSDWRASSTSGCGRLSQLRQASALLVIAASG